MSAAAFARCGGEEQLPFSDTLARDDAAGSIRGAMKHSSIMSPRIRHARPAADFTLEVEFETGERRWFDVTPYLHRGVFVRLQDRAVFRSARVVAGSVEWPGGVDLSYDTLYLEGQPLIRTSM